jgi:hypothetical protein
MTELLTSTFLLFGTGFAFARTSRVHVFTLWDGVRVRENFSRPRFYSLGRGSRSRELLASTFLLFWTGFAFARTSRVHVFTLWDGVCVGKELLALPFHPFPPISGTQGPPRVTVSPLSSNFRHARTSLRYHLPLSTNFRHARTSSRYRFTLFNQFPARKDLLALPFHLF